MSLKSRAELKLQAKQSLEGNWANTIIIFLLFLLLISIATASFIGSIIFSGVLFFGLYAYFLDLIRRQDTSFSHLFSGFDYFIQTLGMYLLSTLYVILWSLLLVIPGIMAAFSYSMIYFVLKDNPGMGVGEILETSKSLMKGHRWRFFVLCLSFFWWFMLAAVTAGIGFIYVGPYLSATAAAFYQDIIDNKA